MPLNFSPRYSITNKIANALLNIEGVKERIKTLPIIPSVLLGLRESAKLYTTHYSTMIEGNRLTEKDVKAVIKENKHIPGKERDEKEEGWGWFHTDAHEIYDGGDTATWKCETCGKLWTVEISQ